MKSAQTENRGLDKRTARPTAFRCTREAGTSRILMVLVLAAVAVCSWWLWDRWLHEDDEPAIFPFAAGNRMHAPTPPGFGTVRWRMSPKEVRAAESRPPVRASASALSYEATILGHPCIVTYVFRLGQLTGTQLLFSSPRSAFLPAPTPDQARRAHFWLKGQLEDRYGTAIESADTTPRPENEEYARRLREAQDRLAERRDYLRLKYDCRDPADKRIERDLAPDRRYIADLGHWIEDIRRADRDDPVLARLASSWQVGAVSIELSTDFSTSPPILEVRYKTTPMRPSLTDADEL